MSVPSVTSARPSRGIGRAGRRGGAAGGSTAAGAPGRTRLLARRRPDLGPGGVRAGVRLGRARGGRVRHLARRVGRGAVRSRGLGPSGAPAPRQRRQLVEDLDAVRAEVVVGTRHQTGARERGARGRRRVGPVLRVRRGEVEQQPRQVDGHLGADELGGDIGRVGRSPRRQQLDGGQPGAVEVGPRVGVPTGRQRLRRGVAERADGVRHVGQPRLVDRGGDAEVGEAHARQPATGRIEEEVGGLDVPVHEPGGVDDLERREQLVEEGRDPDRRQRAVVAHQRRRRAAAHDRHRQQHAVVLARPAERRQHVRVLDPDGLLADEPEQRPRVGLPHHLGGDVAAGAVVPGAPDDTGAALAQRVDELVPPGQGLTHGPTLCSDAAADLVHGSCRTQRQPGSSLSSAATSSIESPSLPPAPMTSGGGVGRSVTPRTRSSRPRGAVST